MGIASAEIEPARSYAAITPHDSNNFTGGVCRAIYVGVGGDVAAVSEGAAAVTFVGVAAGSVLPIKAKRVNATGTTATNLVALY